MRFYETVYNVLPVVRENKLTRCVLYFWAIELPNRKHGHVSETVSCIDAKCSIMTLQPSPSALLDYWCSALLI